MTRLLLLSSVLVLLGCSTDNLSNMSFDKEGSSLIDSLDKYKYVDADCVGYNCDTSNLFRLFLKMQHTFKDSELASLCEHHNPTIRIYAFWTLCKKKYPDLKLVLDKHINDKTQFMFNSGDTGTYYQVNEFLLTLVDPSATAYDDCIKLSDSELRTYKNLMK